MKIDQPDYPEKPSRLHRIALLGALILALLPLALFIYLGSHSRLWLDDFCHLTSGQEYGPWNNVLFWRNTLNGSFSRYFLHPFASPLDTAAPSVLVVIIVVAWLVGIVWLIDAARRLAGFNRLPLAQVILFGSALVALSINGLLDPLSMYHFSAALGHTLPIAILLIALAAACEFAPPPPAFSDSAGCQSPAQYSHWSHLLTPAWRSLSPFYSCCFSLLYYLQSTH